MLAVAINWLLAGSLRTALRARLFVECHAFDSFKITARNLSIVVHYGKRHAMFCTNGNMKQ